MEYQLLRIISSGKPALLKSEGRDGWFEIVEPDKWFDNPRPILPNNVSEVQGRHYKIHYNDVYWVPAFIAGEECFVPGAPVGQSRCGYVKQWHHDNLYTAIVGGKEYLCDSFWGEIQKVMPEKLDV